MQHTDDEDVSAHSTANQLLDQARDSFQKALAIDMSNLKARSGLKRAQSLAAKAHRTARKIKGLELFRKRCEKHDTIIFAASLPFLHCDHFPQHHLLQLWKCGNRWRKLETNDVIGSGPVGRRLESRV